MIKYGIVKIAQKIAELKFKKSYVCVINNKYIIVSDSPIGDVLFLYRMGINNIEKIKHDLFNEMKKVTIAENEMTDEYYEVKTLNNKIYKYKFGEWYE